MIMGVEVEVEISLSWFPIHGSRHLISSNTVKRCHEAQYLCGRKGNPQWYRNLNGNKNVFQFVTLVP